MQVLSNSVANALKLKNDDQLSSTEEFIRKINNAFDILNIRYKAEGVSTRNKFKMLLHSHNDWRFEVSYCLYNTPFTQVIVPSN